MIVNTIEQATEPETTIAAEIHQTITVITIITAAIIMNAAKSMNAVLTSVKLYAYIQIKYTTAVVNNTVQDIYFYITA